MARPRTAVSTTGQSSLTPQVRNEENRWVTAPAGTKPTRWRARTKFRDADGVLRDVERFAPTKSRAETTLRAAVRDRQAPGEQGALRAETTVTDAGALWLRQVDRPDSRLAENTRTQYRYAFERYVKGSSIAGLTLREVNRVVALEGYLQAVADRHGTGAAKTARSVVSAILRLAVRYQALDHNAMRDVRSASSLTPKVRDRDTSRAFSPAERQGVLRAACESERANSQDVVDLVHFLAGTGVRIGEALGQKWADVDLATGTVRVRGTKSAAADRVLSLPSWLAERLEDRAGRMPTDGMLFPTPGTKVRDKPRDLRNVQRIIRQVMTDAGCPWATPHTFRRTVATMLDEAGLPLVLAANQLGHADPSMTARVYLGRKGSTSAAATVL